MIPPNQSRFNMTSECPAACTSASGGIPESGITVIEYMMHMHKRGREGYTQRIDSSNNQSLLASMQHFSFKFQNTNYVPASYGKLYPGDRLITTCVWDSSADTVAVSGGLSSNNEMVIIAFDSVYQLY